MNIADEDKTREQLLSELEELRNRVARLESDNAVLRKMEADLEGKNRECGELSSELNKKYEEIQWHEQLQAKSLSESEQKKTELERYIRQLQRKKFTIRVLILLFFVTITCIALAASLKDVRWFFRSFHNFEDRSYRPMDSDRQGMGHPLKTGKLPEKR